MGKKFFPKPYLVGCSKHANQIQKTKSTTQGGTFSFGTPEMIRTSDARFRKPTLYPLSYGSKYSVSVLTSSIRFRKPTLRCV